MLICGPSMAYPGGMTEVVRAYAEPGLSGAWPVEYVATYAGETFVATLRPRLPTVGMMLVRLGQRRAAILHLRSAALDRFWRKSVLCALAAASRLLADERLRRHMASAGQSYVRRARAYDNLTKLVADKYGELPVGKPGG
jgi:hypothetical protein